MAKRPVSAMGNKRPISEYARRAAALGGNPRYKVNYPRFVWLSSNLGLVYEDFLSQIVISFRDSTLCSACFDRISINLVLSPFICSKS